MDIHIVIIEDDYKYQEDTLVWRLKDRFGDSNVHFFLNPFEGVQFVKAHLELNMIVLLDIDFPAYKISGHDILKDLYETSKLIPVILWSAVDENDEPFKDLINNNAMGFIPKDTTKEESDPIINKAVTFFESSVDNAIEDWIIKNPGDRDKPIYFTSDKKSYSLNDIMHEIRVQSPDGKDFAKKFNALTIDLLLRNREKI